MYLLTTSVIRANYDGDFIFNSISKLIHRLVIGSLKITVMDDIQHGMIEQAMLASHVYPEKLILPVC